MKTVAPKVLLFLPDLSRNTFLNKCLSKIALNAELKNSYHTEIYACADLLSSKLTIFSLKNLWYMYGIRQKKCNTKSLVTNQPLCFLRFAHSEIHKHARSVKIFTRFSCTYVRSVYGRFYRRSVRTVRTSFSSATTLTDGGRLAGYRMPVRRTGNEACDYATAI